MKATNTIRCFDLNPITNPTNQFFTGPAADRILHELQQQFDKTQSSPKE